MQNTYTAIFANGDVVTRKSERGYAFAWRASCTTLNGSKTWVKVGFSRDRASAESAMRSWLGHGSMQWRDVRQEVVNVAVGEPKAVIQK